MAMREQLAQELAPLRKNALENHPWRGWADAAAADAHRMPGESQQAHRMPGTGSRWSGGKDLRWEPLRPERVCEVNYDQLQGEHFRHAAIFLRWRPDKAPQECRYDQLEVTTPFELAKVLAS